MCAPIIVSREEPSTVKAVVTGGKGLMRTPGRGRTPQAIVLTRTTVNVVAALDPACLRNFESLTTIIQ
jgi:hypothetical protein